MHPYKEIYKRQQMGTANKTSRKREPVNICTNGSHFQCHNTIAKRKITIQKTHLSDKTSTSRNKKKKKKVNYEFTIDGEDGKKRTQNKAHTEDPSNNEGREERI